MILGMTMSYTAPIEDDPDFTFAQYAQRCARAMMHLFVLRDRPLEEPLPESLPRSSSARSPSLLLNDLRWRLASATAQTDEEWAVQEAEEHRRDCQRVVECNARSAAMRERYLAMRVRVTDWTPPTPEHAHLKEFMLAQIDAELTWIKPVPLPSLPGTIEERRRAALAALRNQLARRESEAADTQRRDGQNDVWLAALRASLALL